MTALQVGIGSATPIGGTWEGERRIERERQRWRSIDTGTEELEQKVPFILWQTPRKSKVKKHAGNHKSQMFGNISKPKTKLKGQKVSRVRMTFLLSWRPEEDPRRKRHAGASRGTRDTGEFRAQFSRAAPW